MNILDLAIIFVFILFVLNGIYRGFIHTLASIGSWIISWLSGMIFMPVVASIVKNNDKLYNMLLYYTEGSEYIGDAGLANTKLSEVSQDVINSTISNSNLPYPFAKEVSENISKQAFGNAYFGDYFNQTIVNVVINILSFLIVFVIFYVLLNLVIRAIDYSFKFPRLAKYDLPISAGSGFVLGVMWLFILFMLVPLVLIAMKFDFIYSLLDNSFFAPFFYHLSLLLGLMPGT